MKGIASLPLFTDKNSSQEFDFNKLILMPESLNMESGSIEDVAIEAVIRKIATRRYSFQMAPAVPIMSEEEFAKRTAHLSMDDLCKRGLQYISNKVLYGATSWYDWCCDNWGTKWNAYDTEIPGENLIVFTTAWSPPESVIAMLAERYPHDNIEHWWADEDIGRNIDPASIAFVRQFDEVRAGRYANQLARWEKERELIRKRREKAREDELAANPELRRQIEEGECASYRGWDETMSPLRFGRAKKTSKNGSIPG